MGLFRNVFRRPWWTMPDRGAIAAVRSRLLPALAEGELVRAARLGIEPRVECPLCGYRGAAFLPVLSDHGCFRFAARCPDCDALERHRLLALVMRDLHCERWSGDLLHFAPEPSLRRMLSGIQTIAYVSADLCDPHVDCQTDIQAMCFDDDRWSYIVCSHVLEHVADDARALQELRRVLRPGGLLMLCVPFDTRLEDTAEYGEAVAAMHGHRRSYARSFQDVVSQFFEVEVHDVNTRRAADALRCGLTDGDLVMVCSPRK